MTAPESGDGPGGGGAAQVAAGILLSRLAGLVREIVTAGLLGVGVASDAFKAALRIPNLLQNLLGEGVLSASFIPVYARLADTDEEEAGRTAGAVAGLLTTLTAVLVVIGMFAARPLTIALTPGFREDPAKLALTVDLVRIMFPGVGVLVLSAWCLAILNAHRRFFLSYVAPVLWNVAQIVAVTVVAIGGSTPRTLAHGLAWGVVAGGVVQFGVQLPAVRALVPHLRLSLDRHRSSVRDASRRVVSVVFGRGVVQISGYLDMILASLLVTGAVTAGNYAQFFYLLPVSLFGMSVAAAELPELSRIQGPDRVALRNRVEHGLGRVAYFVAPTTLVYVVLGEWVVGGLLQRGEFGASDTRLVWLVLATYSTGLLATTASRLLQNTLYALDDPRTPARIALVRVGLGSVVSLAVMFGFDRLALEGTSITAGADGADLLHLGAVGIALGSAVGSWCEFVLLRKALTWRIGLVAVGGGRLGVTMGAAALAVVAGRLAGMFAPGSGPLLDAVPALAAAGAVYLVLTAMAGLGLRAQIAAAPARRPGAPDGV